MALRTIVGALTVNAAFLQEIKEVNQDLWRLLEVLGDLAGKSGSLADEDLSVFSEALEELRDQLALHFALEEAYGYFEDPVQVAPRLCERAHELRDEHRPLYLDASQLADRAAELLPVADARSRSELANRFRDFCRRLHRHESAENRLILAEYAEDIGDGD